MTNKEKTKKITRLAMLAAISVVLALLVSFPIFPAASFLEYDPADVPILISALLYGPAEGLLVTAIASIMQGLIKSAGSGIIGIIMHIIATGCFCVVTALVARNGEKKRIALALVLGAFSMAAIMIPCNLILTPMYTGATREMIASMLLPVFIPFNLIKAGINAVVTYIVYLPLKKILDND